MVCEAFEANTKEFIEIAIIGAKNIIDQIVLFFFIISQKFNFFIISTLCDQRPNKQGGQREEKSEKLGIKTKMVSKEKKTVYRNGEFSCTSSKVSACFG